MEAVDGVEEEERAHPLVLASDGHAHEVVEVHDDVEEPQPGPGQVRIAVRVTGGMGRSDVTGPLVELKATAVGLLPGVRVDGK